VPIADEPRARLARVAAATGLRVPEDVEHLLSWSNDAWRCGDVIVRVCFLGDRQRLVREAAIGAALPAEVRYPRVLDSGYDDELSWMMVARVAGESLWARRRTMAELRPLIGQVADALRALHAWLPPDDVLALLRAHDTSAGSDHDAVIGHDILPLPTPRWTPLVTAALALPCVDAGIVRAAVARLEELVAHDPFADDAQVVVHGDVNFSNVLAADGEVTALLDFEWARLGPPEAELVSILNGERHSPVVAWLRADYPEMFAHPNFAERVWVTELAYVLRHLVVTQGDADEVRTLARLVDAPWEF
jgi:aminoglycoside phosphotransferase (APT) family kinase protein